jgi:F-type H+-transporting ATPase subunit b
LAISIPVQFAATEEPASGLGAFNLNVKSFLFQLATFVIVLLVLRRFVFPKITATLEARRQSVEESLVKAKQTEEALARAETKAQEIIHAAREQADRALADANSQARDIIQKAEAAAEVQTKRLLEESQERLSHERTQLHDELKTELTDLVIMTTEKVLRQKVNQREDSRLVERAIKELVHD